MERNWNCRKNVKKEKEEIKMKEIKKKESWKINEKFTNK